MRRTCFYPGMGRLSLKLGELRFPSASRLSLTDPPGVVESGMKQLVEVA